MEVQQIKDLRHRLSLSQEQFAHLLGVSLQSVWRWESGLTRPLPAVNRRLEEVQKEAGLRRHRPKGIAMSGTRDSADIGLGAGLGGLFEGLGSLFDLVSKLAEDGQEQSGDSGTVESKDGRMKVVYGLNVRTGLNGKPTIEQFGNVRKSKQGPVVSETREPLVDVLDEETQVVVIAELPGVDEKDVQVQVEGDMLHLSAATKGRKYESSVELPAAVKPESLQSFYRNGILEVRLAKQ